MGTSGGKGLLWGQHGPLHRPRRRRTRSHGRRYGPRRRGRHQSNAHYPVLPRPPSPRYDEHDFSMPPPPPPLFAKKKRRRKKNPVITVKHFHYNMDKQNGRRRHRLRG